jgi:N,N'-diacetylchitobiose phosphorylase
MPTRAKTTVMGHMKRAIQFNLERSGAHGLPCGLSADWNDCIRLGQQGESIFVAFQLRYALRVYLEICRLLAEKEEESGQGSNWRSWTLAWNRMRGTENGTCAPIAPTVSSWLEESGEGKIFLNPQSWASISGHADSERAARAMQSVRERLATEFGLMICDPPYSRDGLPRHEGRAVQ